MKIGLFDHFERSPDRALSTQFDERLAFISAADSAGFYCLHVAEHHSTPLNMTPAASVWLAAVARATKTIRMGPLVYLLPLHSPLQLAEEICMLDHMSGGRIDVGIGRGVSPYEVGYHKVDFEASRDIFIDAHKCLTTALTHETFDYSGPYYQYKDVPMPMQPLQKPHPPYWYASSNTVGSAWAGEHGMHFTSNGPIMRAKENIDAFRAALEKRGGPAHPKPEFKGGTAVGVLRHVFVADTDAEALRLIREPLARHAHSLNWLRELHRAKGGPVIDANVHRSEDMEEWRNGGMLIAGSPATVKAELTRHAQALGINYLICYMFFGTMKLADAQRSLKLFTSEVMPALSAI